MVTRRVGPGRPSKGKRDVIVSRVAWDLGDEVRERAEAEGLTVSDYVARILANELGRPDLAPRIDRRRPEEELPIPAA